MCQPRIPGTVGAEPFSAKIRYTGPDGVDFPNLIKLTVTMPHMDGERLDNASLTSRREQPNRNAFCLHRHAARHLHEASVQL